MPGGAPLCPQQDMAVCTPQADPAARVRVGEYGRVGGVYGRCCADAQAPRPPGRAVRAGAHHEECQEAMGRGASPKLTKKKSKRFWRELPRNHFLRKRNTFWRMAAYEVFLFSSVRYFVC